MSVICWRASSTSERRCSSIPWRFWTSSSASWYRPVGHLERRDRGVELRPGDELPLPELRQPVALQLGLVELRLRLAHHRGLGEVHAVVVAVSRQPQPDARLLERGHRLIQAVLVVLRVDARDGLALLDEAAEVHGDLGEPSDDLRA